MNVLKRVITMQKLNEQQIIDLFKAGRTVILFMSNAATVSCNIKLMSVEMFIDYLSRCNKQGRIL